MKKGFFVGIIIYNTSYFVGIYKTKKEALKIAKEVGGYVEIYKE